MRYPAYQASKREEERYKGKGGKENLSSHSLTLPFFRSMSGWSNVAGGRAFHRLTVEGENVPI